MGVGFSPNMITKTPDSGTCVPKNSKVNTDESLVGLLNFENSFWLIMRY